MTWGKLLAGVIVALGLYWALYWALDGRIDEINLRLANVEGILDTLLDFLTSGIDSDGLAD